MYNYPGIPYLPDDRNKWKFSEYQPHPSAILGELSGEAENSRRVFRAGESAQCLGRELCCPKMSEVYVTQCEESIESQWVPEPKQDIQTYPNHLPYSSIFMICIRPSQLFKGNYSLEEVTCWLVEGIQIQVSPQALWSWQWKAWNNIEHLRHVHTLWTCLLMSGRPLHHYQIISTSINHSKGQVSPSPNAFIWFARYLPSFTESRDAAAHQALAQGSDDQSDQRWKIFDWLHAAISHGHGQ